MRRNRISLHVDALTEYYWVLLGFTGFYWVWTYFIHVYLVLLGFTGFYWVFIGFYLVLPSFTGFYWVLPGFTEFFFLLGAHSCHLLGPLVSD